ncbi:hypothetical protein HID58_073389, partial [Brassica napus]
SHPFSTSLYHSYKEGCRVKAIHSDSVSKAAPDCSTTEDFYATIENSNSVNVTAESCECDRWRVRHSSSSKSSVASLENRRLLTFAKFAEKHRQNPRLLENLSESKAP